MAVFAKVNKTLEDIEHLLTSIERTGGLFHQAVQSYLSDQTEAFSRSLAEVAEARERTNRLRRQIEGDLYTQSMFLRFRGDIMRLLEFLDAMVGTLFNSLYQFEIENPYIPEELKPDFDQLSQQSTKSMSLVIPAVRAYFTDMESVATLIQRVYAAHKETKDHSQAIKWQVFHEMDSLKLSQKFHLRYFALHIENISDEAEKIADQLSVMSIKQVDSHEELGSEERMKVYREFEQSIFQRMMFGEEIGGMYSQATHVQKDFSHKLSVRYPGLTATEKRLVTLLRLDFSTKEIATMMNIEPKSVEIARYRLRRKFSLTRGENLVEFIKTI